MFLLQKGQAIVHIGCKEHGLAINNEGLSLGFQSRFIFSGCSVTSGPIVAPIDRPPEDGKVCRGQWALICSLGEPGRIS